MKGLRSIPRVLKINGISGYRISLLFNNGESRVVDMQHYFANRASQGHQDLVDQILGTKEEFESVRVDSHTLSWPGVGISSTDLEGDDVFYAYDIDPLLLYEASEPDADYNIDLGRKIKTLRLEQGLTQSELAARSGTSKHYISRLENNKSDIEFLTLKKIVEAGLDRKLSVSIS